MITLFFKYFLKQKKFVVFLSFILLFSIVNSLFYKNENMNDRKQFLFGNETSIEYDKNRLIEFEKKLKNETDQKEKEELIQRIEDRKKSIVDKTRIIEAEKNSDWKTIYEYFANDLKRDGDFIGFSVEGFNLSEKTVKISYEILNYLKDKNIPSAHKLRLQRTEYDQPKTTEDKKDVDLLTKKHLIGTNHRLWEFFNGNLVLTYVFMIVVGTGTLFANLHNTENKTIRFLKTTGISKNKIIGAGLFTGLTTTIFLGLSIILIIVGAEYIVSGTSSLEYPIIKYIPMSKYFSTMELDYKFVPISDVLLKSVILFLLYGTFIFFLTSMFSIVFKSKTISIFITFATIIGLQMYKKYYNPFSYWNVGKIADGSINPIYRITTYSYSKSIQILLISIFILFVIIIAFSYFERKFKED